MLNVIRKNPQPLTKAVLEAIASGVLVISPPGRISAWNRRLEAIWRIPDALLVARDERAILQFLASQTVDPEGFLAQVDRICSEPDRPSFDVVRLSDGRIIERYSEAHRQDDEICGRVWCFHDCTPVLHWDREKDRGSRTQSVARLAAGLAHDLTDLFGVIRGCAKLALTQDGPGQDRMESLLRIDAAAQRAVALTEPLQFFGRKRSSSGEGQDFNGLIARIVDKAGAALSPEIELLFEPCTEACTVRCDSSLMEVALRNLVQNAVDAMSEGGQLCISTRPVHIDATHVKNHPEARPGVFVCLAVSDTGPGMCSEVLKQIFQPFFTTKSEEKRAGLGLAKVLAIVRLHRGWVEVDSRLGYGSSFSVFLPTTLGLVSSPVSRDSIQNPA